MKGSSASSALVLRAATIWLALMTVETVHGVLRTLLLAPAIGDFPARQVGVLTGSLLVLLVTALSGPWLRAETTLSQLLVGAFWLLLTLLFEVSLGRFGFGYSWERLASDYNVLRGGLLPFGLLVLLLAPWATARLTAQLRRYRLGDGPGTAP
ncbi:MAG: hypothetical protein AB7K36_09880 [Chloroflexota bacterium]